MADSFPQGQCQQLKPSQAPLVQRGVSRHRRDGGIVETNCREMRMKMNNPSVSFADSISPAGSVDAGRKKRIETYQRSAFIFVGADAHIGPDVTGQNPLYINDFNRSKM